MLDEHPSVIFARENAVREHGTGAIVHKEIKPHKSLEEQLSILSACGLIMDDRYETLGLLERIGYYHLSGYMLTLKERDGSFRKGVTASQVIRLYSLDQALRNSIRNMLDRIEITLRTQVSYAHTAAYGPLGYCAPANFIGGGGHKFNHGKMIDTIADGVKKQWRVPFITHHLLRYDGKFPLWVILEIMMFGATSMFFSGMHAGEKRAVAAYWGIDFEILQNWLICLTDLRNICAHHGRLYNRTFTNMPKIGLFRAEKESCDNLGLKERRLFWQIVPVCVLLTTDRLRNAFKDDLSNCIARYASPLDLQEIGFPNDWDAYLDRILTMIPARQ